MTYDDWKTKTDPMDAEEPEEEPLDPEACPGCGCLPGDGVTEGCDHPGGCGYNRQAQAEWDARPVPIGHR